MYIIGISVSFIRAFCSYNEKSFRKVWWFHIYLLNLPPRTYQRWFFGVADGECSPWVARHIRKRVRFISCLRIWTIRNQERLMHERLVRIERTLLAPLRLYHVNSSHCTHIRRRCELYFTQFFPHRSVQNLQTEKRQRLTPFFCALFFEQSFRT